MFTRRRLCIHGCFWLLSVGLLLAASGCTDGGKSDQTCDSVETCQPLSDSGYQFVQCCTRTECVIVIEGSDEEPHPSDNEVLCDGLDCTNALFDLSQEYCGGLN